MNALKYIGIICVIIWVGFPLLTYMFYWYETANDKQSKLLLGADPRRTFFIGLFTSILFLPVLVLTYPFGLRKGLWVRLSKDKPVANVVMIHGLFHNPSAWLILMFILPRKRFNCFAVGYSCRKGTFDRVAQYLANYMEDKIDKQLPLIFIGHSLGGILAGLVAYVYVTKGWKVKGVITLGTPFRGSKLTVFTSGKLARSLSYEDPSLLKGVSILDNPPFKGIQFWSPADNMVLPISSMLSVPKGWLSERVSPICHTSMLFWPCVVKRICEVVDNLSEPACDVDKRGVKE